MEQNFVGCANTTNIQISENLKIVDIVNIVNIIISDNVPVNIVNTANIDDSVNISISDNVPVNIDGVLFLHITDTFKASYEVQL